MLDLLGIHSLLPLCSQASFGDMRFDPANSTINGTTYEGLIQVSDGFQAGWVCDDVIDTTED